MRSFWQKLRIPKVSRLGFDHAVATLRDGLATLFAPFSYGETLAAAYYPAKWRNPILQGGSDMTLLAVTYDGIEREVEPYSLAFKRRKDGVSFEFADGKPLELLGGSNLLFLLQEHACIDAKIEPPEDWTDPIEDSLGEAALPVGRDPDSAREPPETPPHV
jgi:hypothetical protein